MKNTQKRPLVGPKNFTPIIEVSSMQTKPELVGPIPELMHPKKFLLANIFERNYHSLLRVLRTSLGQILLIHIYFSIPHPLKNVLFGYLITLNNFTNLIKKSINPKNTMSELSYGNW